MDKIINRFVTTAALLIVVFTLFITPVLAQADITFDPGGKIGEGVDPINLPVFLDIDEIRNFSIFSYVALVINLIFVALALYWVFLAIRGAVDIMRSEGDEGMIGEGKKRFGNIFWSITFLFGFFAVLAIVAAFFGLGSFWNWPRALSYCEDGTFYFTKGLEYPDATPDEISDFCERGV